MGQDGCPGEGGRERGGRELALPLGDLVSLGEQPADQVSHRRQLDLDHLAVSSGDGSFNMKKSQELLKVLCPEKKLKEAVRELFTLERSFQLRKCAVGGHGCMDAGCMTSK